MKRYRSISEFTAGKKTVVTIGTFDGVHSGHRKIIERLVESAKVSGAESLILTFFPHPRFVLGKGDFQLLNTQSEKQALLAQTGLDHLVIHPFDEAFSQLEAREFVEQVLVGQFNIGKIIIGHDHRFGKGRTAGIHDLIEFGKEFHFDVEQIRAQEIDAVSVSSTKIRRALAEGDIAKANAYLEYPYLLSGTVVRGRQLGRTIGFPTANLKLSEAEKLVPKDGVYIVKGEIGYGMMSIGTNPTVGGTNRTIEIYFLDFDGDLYGDEISVGILHRLRDEENLASIDILKTRIGQDLADTKSFIAKL